MRALLQRVTQASCTVEGTQTGACGHGLVVFLGVGPDDNEAVARRLWNKIYGLRMFDDKGGKTNLSLHEVGGEALIVSQFTLYADCRHGRRPSLNGAAAPALAMRLYDFFCDLAEADLGHAHVGRGVFGADMEVSLTNDGPFTIWLDTDELTSSRH